MNSARRLAAVMFTDLVGFTKLGQRNEDAALRLRKEHQALLRPLFAAHGGREVKSLGDGFLVEFPSAVESVRCAVAIQETAATRNARSPSDERIVLRIGIHVGDVVQEGEDIVGDAVNVASRIEPLAEPGGISVSGSVFEQVRNKVKYPLESVGARQLKNVEYPVDIYRVNLSGLVASPPPPPTGHEANLRVAVLPLANLSPDAHDDYFADGLTDELISQVSKIPSLRVIARTSILRYKGSSKSIRDVAQDLGVGLVVEGSVRKAGNRLRVMIQLVDTMSEEPLWSSRYDRPLDDIFSIQDDIAGQVASSISGHLGARGITTLIPFVRGSPHTPDLEAYSQFLHGRQLLQEKGSEATLRQALALFESAVQRDSKFARARVGVAESLLWLATEGAYPFVEANQRARQELAKALELDDALAEAHSVLSGFLIGIDDAAGAEREARRAMELNPSLSDPYRWMAQLRAGDGKIDESIHLLESARQLDPVDINIAALLGRCYFYAGREGDALAFWERTKPMIPFRTNAHLTEFYLSRRDYAKADGSLREMERLRPGNVWLETYRGMWAAFQGDSGAARAAIERLQRKSETGEFTVFHIGFVHFALGELEPFFACQEESLRLHILPLLELQHSPLFASVRSDPRFVDLLRRQHELSNLGR